VGEVTVQFHRARWEDMPTQYNILNIFHDMESKEYYGASVTKTGGDQDLGNQRFFY
jgi:hypothetical protein